jgi:hypothetical protein
MLTPAKQTIYAMIDELRAETGDAIYLNVTRAFEPGLRALPTLVYVAEVRSGEVRGRNYPLFDATGEQCLRTTGATEEDALDKLAALCSVTI